MASAKQDYRTLSNAELRIRFAKVTSEIEQLHAELACLETTQESIADALESIVYPIVTLPAEIASDIFAHHIYGLKHEDPPGVIDLRFSRNEGPLWLAQVCRSWRAIVLNTPSLWCSVRVSSDPSWTPVPDWRQLLQCWLPRARGHTMYLDFIAGGDPRQTELLFPIAAAYCTQWRSFSGYLHTSDASAFDIIQHRVPLLHQLALQSKEDFSAPTPIASFSPRAARCFSAPQYLVLPWAQITNLTLCRLTVPDCINLLHYIPLLQLLSVDLHLPRSSNVRWPLPVALQHLHTLVVTDWELFEWTSSFFTFIACPRLTSFRISRSDNPDTLLDFLRRSQCALESLHTELQAVYDLAPLAYHVSLLTVSDMSANALACFCGRIATDPVFLPSLQSLQITQYTAAIPYSEITQMLSARWYNRGTKPKLSSFRLTRCVEEEEDDNDPYNRNDSSEPDEIPDPVIADKLRALVSDGLEIWIQSWQDEEYHVNKFSP
ncbi:F-box domain-containing protein [Favolaschia claudopus]|uniref:F-box domain-containing protein n=1 Tax=Favolaschia claudopus TaxID=2862362 RepID=A0AAW0EDF9_9AGAR